MSNITVPAGAVALREPRPLTDEEQRLVEQRRQERLATQWEGNEAKLEKLASKFGRPEKVRTEDQPKPVNNNGWDKPITGSVDWEKQNQRFDQQRTGGKRKNISGKKG